MNAYSEPSSQIFHSSTRNRLKMAALVFFLIAITALIVLLLGAINVGTMVVILIVTLIMCIVLVAVPPDGSH